MTGDSKLSSYTRILDVVGVVMALAALGIIGRFALLLIQAFQGHPRLIGESEDNALAGTSPTGS
jgi:hypothetical protein